jgi:hypothetical protein
MKPALKVGDLVKYRVDFLRSVGAYVGELPFMRGVIMSIKPAMKNGSEWTLVEIDFGGNDYDPHFVNAANITLASDPEYSSY